MRFKGRDLVLCTQHQLKGVDRDQVGMLSDKGEILVTSDGMRHYHPSPDADALDLVAFDFTGPSAAHPDFKRRFFNFNRVPPHVPLKDVLCVMLIGFPFDDQRYRLDEASSRIHVVRRTLLCTMDDKPPADNALLRVTPREPLEFDPNGMSGGSAFVVQVINGRFEADFAGIIARGGPEGFYLLKAGTVRNILSSF